ncbi:MAG: radical SAM protein [Candidatus Hydrogenedentes bacterium]|nr:radical SAM protein [Candidatus Hydrogenedentota bacterium]
MTLSPHETKWDRIRQWQRGETPGPWAISLYPTYRCNIECKICWKRAFEEPLKANEELPDERMLALVDEAAELGVREWTLGGGGELMLRRNVVMEVCKRIRDHGMHGTIQTNGTIFSDKHVEQLIDIQWPSIFVSLDGPTREINNAIRVEKNFDMTIDFLERIQRRKKERGSALPVMNIVTVITNLNYDRMHLFVDLAERLELAPGVLTCVDLIVYGENDRKYLLTPEQRRQLPDRMSETIAYANERGVPHQYHAFLEGLSGEGEHLDALDLFNAPESAPSSKTMCFEPFLHMVIVPEGNTGPCCTWHDLSSDNIREQSLRDAWTGPYLARVREQILTGKPPQFCTECMVTRIQENAHMQQTFGKLEQAAAGLDRLTLPAAVAKAARSLKNHGVAGSFRRGREWVQIRNAARDLARKSNGAG